MKLYGRPYVILNSAIFLQLWRLTFWTRYSREERIDVDQERLEREKKKSESDGHVNPGFLGIPEDTDAQGGGGIIFL